MPSRRPARREGALELPLLHQALLPDHPPGTLIRHALEAARVARFMVDEWDAHIMQYLAIMDARGMISHAEKRGRQLGELLGCLRLQEQKSWS